MFKGAEKYRNVLSSKKRKEKPKKIKRVRSTEIHVNSENRSHVIVLRKKPYLPSDTFCPFFIVWTIGSWASEECRKNVLFFRGKPFFGASYEEFYHLPYGPSLKEHYENRSNKLYRGRLVIILGNCSKGTTALARSHFLPYNKESHP